jgi:hypothetical protein
VFLLDAPVSQSALRQQLDQQMQAQAERDQRDTQ